MRAVRAVIRACGGHPIDQAFPGWDAYTVGDGIDLPIRTPVNVGRYAVDRVTVEMLVDLGYEWVIFQDSDDARREGALDVLWENRVRGGVVVGGVEWHYLNGRRRIVKPLLDRRGWKYRWHYGAALWDIHAVRPLISPQYRISWDMMVAYQAVNTLPVKVVDAVVYDWWEREGSLTTSPETGMRSPERARVNRQLAAMMR